MAFDFVFGNSHFKGESDSGMLRQASLIFAEGSASFSRFRSGPVS